MYQLPGIKCCTRSGCGSPISKRNRSRYCDKAQSDSQPISSQTGTWLTAVILLGQIYLLVYIGNCSSFSNFPFSVVLLNLFFLPAATKLGQGNIFTGVCLPQCMLGYPLLEQTPPQEQTLPLPPRSRPPRSRPPWEQTPQEQTPPSPGADHPPPRDQAHPLGKQTAAYG